MNEATGAEAAVRPRQSRARRALWLAARVAVTAAAFGYLFSIVELDKLLAAFSSISAAAAVSAIGLIYFAMAIAALRWRALLAAYGATRPPAPLRLFRLHLIGLFFNSYLPGGVGGDVVRGIATREAFSKEGATGSLAVVLVERIAGVSGLLLLTGVTFALRPLPRVENVALWDAAGMAVAIGSVLSIALGRRFSGYFPGPLGRIAASLPEIKSAPPFVLAVCLSVATQTCSALIGHVLVSSIAHGVRLSDSLVVVPLAVATGYFPLTVAGAGVREAAFVALYGLVGVSRADALAGSLTLLLCQLAVAATGGLLNIIMPLSESRE